MLLTKEVEVKLWGTNIKHYKSLGYKGKQGDIITVKIEDLSRGCNVRITVACDYCGAECNPRYVNYCDSVEIDGTYACGNCGFHKAEKTMLKEYGVPNYSSTKECREKVVNTMMSRYGVNHVSKNEEFLKRKRDNNKEKYGVEHTFQVKEFREKGIQTNLQKFGVEYASQSEEIQEKIRNTTQQRFGVPYASQSPEIKEKISQTNLERYGYECVLQVPEIQEKISNTIKNVYGVDNVSQSDEIKGKKSQTVMSHFGVEQPSLSDEILEKRRKTFYKNGTTPTSKQQFYIFNLYQSVNTLMKLNYPISYFSADICILDEKIDIEIDFGGHNLQVKLGHLTQEEFDHKELIRDKVIKSKGYKLIKISSETDKLPSDQILLQMLQESRDYFSKTSHTWQTYDIDKSMLFNAEHKQGIPYDFGFLRTIKDSDISSQSVS